MPSCQSSTNRSTQRVDLRALQVNIAFAIAASTAFPQSLAITTLGSTIRIDANVKSPTVIAFDPHASVEGFSGFVNGTNSAVAAGPVTGTNMNAFLGAETFYNHGYRGTGAVIANIESGHIWSDHESLAHVQQIPNHSAALNEFDRHATQVGMILGGRRGGANPGPYQEGMAPDAQLFSGAFATQWNGQRPSLNFSSTNAIIFDQYRKAFSTGLNPAGRTADVINSSWGNSAGANGSDTYAIGLDGFANANPRTLFVAIAGNSGPGPDKVGSPASGYNNLSVAALGSFTPYNRPASFSSGGPNDYVDPVNGTANDARQVVDIAAPGQNLSSAYYGGESGGNGTTDNPAEVGPGPTGPPNGVAGGPDFYIRGGLNGTSLAAPAVAGGAALLYDAAYSVFSTNADARDARVMKAVLMNSADKTIGWDNGQTPHPNGNGGVRTTQGLDNRVGTGRMNLETAYGQFLGGTTDVPGVTNGDLGFIESIGWDFGEVASGETNDYFFDAPLVGGSIFTATLTWFRDRKMDHGNDVFDESYDDLNLELWSVANGAPVSLVSESSSLYNESEHFSFALPTTGEYALRVRWIKELFDRIGDANQELYGLAWSAVAGLAGDFNTDGTVDAADYVVWRNTDGTQTGYDAWRANFGTSLGDNGGSAAYPLSASDVSLLDAVPEPASILLGAAAICIVRFCHSNVRKRSEMRHGRAFQLSTVRRQCRTVAAIRPTGSSRRCRFTHPGRETTTMPTATNPA